MFMQFILNHKHVIIYAQDECFFFLLLHKFIFKRTVLDPVFELNSNSIHLRNLGIFVKVVLALYHIL